MLISSAIVLNQFSWVIFFDMDGLLSLSKKIIFGILDIFLIMSAFLFYSNNRQKNYYIFYIKLILINSTVIISLLFILELFFGNWLNSNKLNNLNIIMGKTINYNIDALYPWYTDKITYVRDEWGFRGEYPDLNSIDILTVGGSTTDQRYISEGHTFQDVLRKKFKKNGKNIFVVNAGIDGQSTFGHIKNFDLWFSNIPDLKVKYFLFFIGVNDFYKDDHNQYDNLNKQTNNSITSIIESNSALYHLYKTIKGMYFAKVYGLSHDVGHKKSQFSTKTWVSYPLLSNHKEIIKGRLSSYEQRLNILCKKVKSFGSIPIFVTQSQRRLYDFIDQNLYGEPNVFKNNEGQIINGVDYYYMMKLLHESTKKISNDNGGIFINLDHELIFDIKNDFYDSAHQTPSGAKKIGEYLFQKLNYLF